MTSSVDVISLTSVFLHQGPDERPGPTGASTLTYSRAGVVRVEELDGN